MTYFGQSRTTTSANKGKPSPRWAINQKFVIADRNDEDADYLVRWRLVQTPWFGVYLHHILLPDSDLNPHTHPWPFASLVLKGGYVEHLFAPLDFLAGDSHAQVRTRRRWAFGRFPYGRAHRIDRLLGDTWTLLLVGPRRESWGFWTRQRVPTDEPSMKARCMVEVDWRDYTSDMVRPA